jgi:hypothetical protein
VYLNRPLSLPSTSEPIHFSLLRRRNLYASHLPCQITASHWRNRTNRTMHITPRYRLHRSARFVTPITLFCTLAIDIDRYHRYSYLHVVCDCPSVAVGNANQFLLPSHRKKQQPFLGFTTKRNFKAVQPRRQSHICKIIPRNYVESASSRPDEVNKCLQFT